MYSYKFPLLGFGFDTSNINESLNSAWGQLRFLQPLQMMDGIYSVIMKTVYNRYHRLQRSAELVDIQLSRFNDRLANSRQYHVVTSGNRLFQVQKPDTGVKRVVDLPNRTCDCNNFYEYQSPCAHAIAACR